MVTDSLAGLLETSASRAPTAPGDGEGGLELCCAHSLFMTAVI